MQFKPSADTSLIENVSGSILTLTATAQSVFSVISIQDVCSPDIFNLSQPACPVCHVPLTIDLEAPALELEENTKVRQGILGRLDLDKWRSSSKIEALVEELSNLRRQDATTKSIVFSQFVNFLDLIAYRLQRAGFSVRDNLIGQNIWKIYGGD